MSTEYDELATAHAHTQRVPGCFRCDLSADEVRSTTDDPTTLDRAADGIEAYFGDGCTEYVMVVKWLRSRAAHARMEKFAAGAPALVRWPWRPDPEATE